MEFPINVADKVITLTADKTLIKDNSGKAIALFEDGKIKAECISSNILIRPFELINLLDGNNLLNFDTLKNYRIVLHDSAYNGAYVPCDGKYGGYETKIFVDVSSSGIVGNVLLMIDRERYPNSRFIYQGMDHTKACYTINVLWLSMAVISAIPRDGYVDWFVENTGDDVIPIV